MLVNRFIGWFSFEFTPNVVNYRFTKRKAKSLQQIHIVGKKNSGKTTLIVELVQHYTANGLRVGTVKHTHHHHELDTPGKDSHRHREAGAVAVGILAPSINAVFWKSSEEDTINRYQQFTPIFSDCDLLLVEGHYQTTAPKLEVWRSEVIEEPLAKSDTSIIAVISDEQLELTTPIWSRSDITALAEKILQQAGTN